MLPFLKPKSIGGSIITQNRKPDGMESPQDESGDEGLSAAAADLIRAVHAKDEQGVVSALRAAFEMLDSAEMPVDEQESE